MLDVTVCILSYNRPVFLREALLSVMAQTRKPRKIAIYDNGSNRDVYENIKDILGERVQWVGAEVNHTVIWNFTRAMHECETRYVMMLHDDDRLYPDFIETQIALLEKNAECVAASCNGFFIDETGKKIGGTLTRVIANNPVEKFTCSGQVALRYAGNSCIPFSPSIYRTQIARTVKFREGFEKVCDAVFFCDLADIGTIAYQTAPLYECRVHSGQDSTNFPFELINRLDDFFESRRCQNEAEKAKLTKQLIKQKTERILKQLYQLPPKGCLSKAAKLLSDDKFRFAHAVKTVAVWIYKYIFVRNKFK